MKLKKRRRMSRTLFFFSSCKFRKFHWKSEFPRMETKCYNTRIHSGTKYGKHTVTNTNWNDCLRNILCIYVLTVFLYPFAVVRYELYAIVFVYVNLIHWLLGGNIYTVDLYTRPFYITSYYVMGKTEDNNRMKRR